MFLKLIDFLNEDHNEEEKIEMVNTVGAVVIPLLVLGLLFFVAIILGLIHL